MNIRQDSVYCGIGSRKTPQSVLYQMTDLAKYLACCGWILRSGGAFGADTAFEEGAREKEIFLPTNDIPSEAFQIASLHHPTWDGLKPYVKKLHARNIQQILGKNLDTPVYFVVCWTPDGAETKTSKNTGGTGQAIRVANANNIPVYNLFNEDRLNKVKEFCDCKLLQYSDYYE